STIHGLFERQVERTPEKVAVRDGSGEVTFRELNRRANRLAHFLRRRGVGPEVAVGVSLERTVRMPEALLAVLKSGGAFMPLDPSYPAERLGFMLRDSEAPVLLTEDRLAGRFPAGQAEIVRLDSGLDLSAEPDTNPGGGARSDSLAYVIYTSGSTGTPKGVEAIHRASVNRFAWMWAAYPFERGEVCCQKTALSFVDSVWEIFGPLLQGIPLVILSDEAVKDPRSLVRGLADGGVTRIVLVPSLLRGILDSGADLARELSRLRLWVASGETLPAELYSRFRAALPDAVLLNLYGSSEVTADVTCYAGEGETPEGVGIVPIGRPISNTQIYILDGSRQPVPPGVTGEIYVGGHGLARGYRHRPDLTAERFIADPFRRAPGARLFRTGDRGRYRTDGQIEYLGRADHQIKLRGRRIELGEIESALAAHPAVTQAVVTLREDHPGDARLVAYVVSEPEAAGATVDWRSFLASRLPDFMVPSTFVSLDALPLTPSGKIDRAALPGPGAGRPQLAAVFVPPRNTVEERIAGVWSDILGAERVGIHDNFFDLGGHSLLAVRLVARLEKEFGRPVALATVFRAPTVAELAEILEGPSISRRRVPSLIALQSGGTRPPFYCVHAIGGIVQYHYRGLARAQGPDQPFYGLQSQGLDGGRAPYETVEEMAAHYIREIREVQPHGPYYLGGYSFGGKVAFEMARQLRAQGERTAFLAFFDTFNIPLTPGPTRLDVVRGRTRAHIAALRKGSLRQKASYLLDRVETLRTMLRRRRDRILEPFVKPMERAQRKVRKANLRATMRYVAGYYEGGATIFRAIERTTDRDRVQTYPLLGWEKLCGEGVEICEVPGGHSSLMEEEANVRRLGEALAERLRRAQELELGRVKPPPAAVRSDGRQLKP
ncbi:MAG: amino acid adenylation domain-containing protein, partial [Acidobacteriota bacterium]